jgi:hypothetical protein
MAEAIFSLNSPDSGHIAGSVDIRNRGKIFILHYLYFLRDFAVTRSCYFGVRGSLHCVTILDPSYVTVSVSVISYFSVFCSFCQTE